MGNFCNTDSAVRTPDMAKRPLVPEQKKQEKDLSNQLPEVVDRKQAKQGVGDTGGTAGAEKAPLLNAGTQVDETKSKLKAGDVGGAVQGIAAAVGKKPFFVINGFYMQMREAYTAAGNSIYYYSVEWDSGKLSWADFRGTVLGATNPSEAAAGSLRRTILDEYKSLGLSSEPNVGDNGLHASASPFEAFAERLNWLQAALEEDPFGKALLAAGLAKDVITAWTKDPQVDFGGETVSLFDSLEDINANACIDRCQTIAGVEKVDQNVTKNAALVFIKPHAVNDAVKDLVSKRFAELEFTIVKEGVLTAEEISEKQLIENHYYAIANKAALSKPKDLNPPQNKREDFNKKFGITWEKALEDGCVFNAVDGCKELGLDVPTFTKIWDSSKKSVIKFGGGFYCAKFDLPEEPEKKEEQVEEKEKAAEGDAATEEAPKEEPAATEDKKETPTEEPAKEDAGEADAKAAAIAAETMGEIAQQEQQKQAASEAPKEEAPAVTETADAKTEQKPEESAAVTETKAEQEQEQEDEAPALEEVPAAAETEETTEQPATGSQLAPPLEEVPAAKETEEQAPATEEPKPDEAEVPEVVVEEKQTNGEVAKVEEETAPALEEVAKVAETVTEDAGTEEKPTEEEEEPEATPAAEPAAETAATEDQEPPSTPTKEDAAGEEGDADGKDAAESPSKPELKKKKTKSGKKKKKKKKKTSPTKDADGSPTKPGLDRKATGNKSKRKKKKKKKKPASTKQADN